jgi:hypothetical protein
MPFAYKRPKRRLRTSDLDALLGPSKLRKSTIMVGGASESMFWKWQDGTEHLWEDGSKAEWENTGAAQKIITAGGDPLMADGEPLTAG